MVRFFCSSRIPHVERARDRPGSVSPTPISAHPGEQSAAFPLNVTDGLKKCGPPVQDGRRYGWILSEFLTRRGGGIVHDLSLC